MRTKKPASEGGQGVAMRMWIVMLAALVLWGAYVLGGHRLRIIALEERLLELEQLAEQDTELPGPIR